ncbi:MAG: TraB/GumN family protein [Deltaproteobacteria bacterium]|jgi:uncharacterized protein YbaP (TraB family)|nr:TraB/GumN family protein [Deltaproteobacteria bacterium]
MPKANDIVGFVRNVRLRAVFLALILALALAPATGALAQGGKSFVWSVSDDTGPRLYLMGSIHMAREDLYPLSPVYGEAFGRATSLVVEVDTSKLGLAKLAGKTLSMGLYPGDETVWDHLDAQTAALLRECLKKTGLDEALVAKMRPWLVAMVLGVAGLQLEGYQEDLGLDLHFIAEAKSRGLPVYELEEADEQIDVLTAFDEVDSILFLKNTLLEFGQIGTQIEGIFNAWKKGDAKGLADLFFQVYKENPEIAPVMVKLIDERNAKMFKRLQPLMPQGKLPFVIIGASHLLGENGLLETFKAAGFRVEQL